MSILVDYVQNSIHNFDPKKFILNSELFYLFLFFHIIWWLIYGFIHFFINVNLEKKKELYDTKTRFVSIIHASLIFVLSAIDTFLYQDSKCGCENTYFQTMICLISASYFLYDLINCILLDVSDTEMVFHHISVILGYWSGLAYNNSAREMIRALVVSEITCPIMHLRMILKNYGLKNTKLHFVLDVIYMATYLIARMIYGTRVIIYTVFCKTNLIIVKAAGIFVWVQSIIFSRRMIHIIRHRYLEYVERNEKGVCLFWLSNNKKIEDLEYYKKSLTKASYIP